MRLPGLRWELVFATPSLTDDSRRVTVRTPGLLVATALIATAADVTSATVRKLVPNDWVAKSAAARRSLLHV